MFVSVCAGMEDLPPVPLRVCMCRGEAEGGGETGGKAKAERCKKTGEIDRKSRQGFFFVNLAFCDGYLNSYLNRLCYAETN